MHKQTLAIIVLTGLTLALAALPSHGEPVPYDKLAPQTLNPHSGDHDHRIRLVPFKDLSVIHIDGCMNFQTMITFGSNEHIENVGVGDSNQWQILPNKRADLLFVKPIAPKAFSNMTVVTDLHSYNFELTSASDAACKKGDVTYDLRFTYPALEVKSAPSATDPESLLPVPEKRHTAYSYSGAKDIVPLRVFDDGKSTYFRWPEGVVAPAIYAIGADKSESLINFANRGDFIVVEQVAASFTLRRGALVTTVYNEGYLAPSLDQASPKPRTDETPKKKPSFWDRLAGKP